MRTSKGKAWGSFLLLFGLIWLLKDLDIFVIDWSLVLPFWPVLLIIAGLILIVSSPKVGRGNGFVGLLITLAVFGAIFNKTDRKIRHLNGNNWNFFRDDDQQEFNRGDQGFFGDSEEQKDHGYLKDRNNKNSKSITGNFRYEMQDFIQRGKLNIEGGAGSFKLKEDTHQLFEANTHSNFVGFVSDQKLNRLDNLSTINLKMEEGNVKIKNGNITNEAIIKLNTKPIWEIDLGIGAGKGDFDFSQHKVEFLKISTGVADLDIKMGDRVDHAKIDVEAGVAAVTIEVPNNVGCEVRMDGALNVKSMDDLEKVSDGLYQSPGYSTASKKITINFEGGLSKVKIRRY